MNHNGYGDRNMVVCTSMMAVGMTIAMRTHLICLMGMHMRMAITMCMTVPTSAATL